jgi:ubiquinone/menaquinone biosynthesis C-methylase UbiE
MKVSMSIQNAYNEWSETYDTDENLTRDLDQKVTRETLSNMYFNAILEIGCGTGVHGIDFSPGMIEKAKEKVKAKNVKFSIADITEKWNFADQSFNLIVCNLVLEHIQDLSFVFLEASRTLREEGRFFINELHPFKQYEGKKARFTGEKGVTEIQAFVHHISDFLDAATSRGLTLVKLSEYWHEADQNGRPRLVSFMFEKR